MLKELLSIPRGVGFRSQQKEEVDRWRGAEAIQLLQNSRVAEWGVRTLFMRLRTVGSQRTCTEPRRGYGISSLISVAPPP